MSTKDEIWWRKWKSEKWSGGRIRGGGHLKGGEPGVGAIIVVDI
jgi:hypothetical protein